MSDQIKMSVWRNPEDEDDLLECDNCPNTLMLVIESTEGYVVMCYHCQHVNARVESL